MRPSAAGPCAAPPARYESSAGSALSKCAMPPAATMFFAQASGLAFREVELPCDWVQKMSWSKMMSSASAEIEVYCVVRGLPHEAVVNMTS